MGVHAIRPVRLAYRGVRPAYSLDLGFALLGLGLGHFYGLVYSALLGHLELTLWTREALLGPRSRPMRREGAQLEIRPYIRPCWIM